MDVGAQIRGIISRTIPQFGQDTTEQPVRLSRYQEMEVIEAMRTKHPLAEEGSYWTCQASAIGTAIALPVSAAYSVVAGLAVFYNNDSPNNPNAKNIFLDRIGIIYDVAPASATAFRCAFAIDTQTNRTPTADATLVAGQGGTIGQVQVGPVSGAVGSITKIWVPSTSLMEVVPTSTTQRVCGLGATAGLPVVGQGTDIKFGSDGILGPGATIQLPPIVIPPGAWGVLYGWWPGNATTGASVEMAFDWFER